MAETMKNSNALKKMMDEIPPSEILYFKNGNVEKVIVHEKDDFGLPELSKYRRWGNRYFHYVEGHAVLMENKVSYDKLPDKIKEIFNAKNIEGVAALRKAGKLEGYVYEVSQGSIYGSGIKEPSGWVNKPLTNKWAKLVEKDIEAERMYQLCLLHLSDNEMHKMGLPPGVQAELRRIRNLPPSHW